MKIIREYKLDIVDYYELVQGDVFSDSDGEGLYLYLDIDDYAIRVFDLEKSTLAELDINHHPKVVIRKVNLVVED